MNVVASRSRALSLTEVVGALVISSLVLIASLETLAGSLRTLGWTNDGVKAVMLAEERMAEVLCKRYEDPDGNSAGIGRESDESATPTNRLTFDDIDDYDGVTNTPPETTGGSPSPGFTGWTLAFEVEHVEVDPGAYGDLATSPTDTGLKRVTVKVTDPGGAVTRLSTLRSRHGPTEEPAPFDVQRTVLFQAVATVGDSAYLEQGTELLNGGDRP